MNSRRVITRVLMLCALFILPRSGFAQEAVLTGTITDSSGGVLPGVTITAVHTASGNNFADRLNDASLRLADFMHVVQAGA